MGVDALGGIGKPLPPNAAPMDSPETVIKKMDCVDPRYGQGDGRIDDKELGAALKLDFYAPGRQKLKAQAVDHYDRAKASVATAEKKLAEIDEKKKPLAEQTKKLESHKKIWDALTLTGGVGGAVAGVIITLTKSVAVIGAAVPWLAPLAIVLAVIFGLIGAFAALMSFLNTRDTKKVAAQSKELDAERSKAEEARKNAEREVENALREISFANPETPQCSVPTEPSNAIKPPDASKGGVSMIKGSRQLAAIGRQSAA